MQSTKVVKMAQELLKSEGYFVDNLWHVNDIHFICEQQGLPPISNEEAQEVFGIANGQFDGEVGLSWPQLEKALRAYLQHKTIMPRTLDKELL